MRIVFWGTPDEAALILKALLDSEKEVVGVVTQPDRPKGRGLKVGPSPVKILAKERGLAVLTPEKLSEEKFLKDLHDLDADIGVVVAYGKIITKEILDLSRSGLINIHASLLPRYRGAARRSDDVCGQIPFPAQRAPLVGRVVNRLLGTPGRHLFQQDLFHSHWQTLLHFHRCPAFLRALYPQPIPHHSPDQTAFRARACRCSHSSARKECAS